MKKVARCPHCGHELEFIETLYRDVGTALDYRTALERWWCNTCDKPFAVEAYYPYDPVGFGEIEEDTD